MVDASPNGKHMNLETFEAVLEFVKQVGLPFIMISGGEPTEHPNLLEMLPPTKSFGLHTILLSNGEFLHKSNPNSILELVDGVQVTNDPRYYSRSVPDFVHPKVTFERQIRILSPFGRAITNKLTTTQKYPGCFNIRSTTRLSGLFVTLIVI
jgi:organic radical activating enzyme